MNWLFLSFLILGVFMPIVLAGSDSDAEKKARVIGLFNVVKFPNDPCNTTSSSITNGTCYTSSECTSRGGKSTGSCANGYGVCCSFQKGCGSTSSENSTYLDSSISTDTSCTYTICPTSSNICRIRFDLKTFSITGPVTSATSTTDIGGSIGDCATDRFSISAPGSKGSPVICGTNDGQHMILDVATQCLTANFYISSTSTTKNWLIFVTQHACGSDVAGPTGCLQYFYGPTGTGTLTSFNYLSTSTGHHLSNQDYDICIRRESGNCKICYVESSSTGSFGLSLSSISGMTAAGINTDCSDDYISVYGGYASSDTSISVYRNCGRHFSFDNAVASGSTICTQLTPFRVSVKTDADEVISTTGDPSTDELEDTPAGTLGFSLMYAQSC